MNPDNKQLFTRMSKGLFSRNALLGLSIGLCPAIAVSTEAQNGFAIGVAVLFVQVITQSIISLAKKWISPSVQLPIFLVITAGMVTVVDRCMAAFTPALYSDIKLYLQLVVTFISVLAVFEAFTSTSSPVRAIITRFGQGSTFLLSLFLISAFREILGQGSFWGHTILPYKLLPLITTPAGGFFTISLFLALIAMISKQPFTLAGCLKKAEEETTDPSATTDTCRAKNS